MCLLADSSVVVVVVVCFPCGMKRVVFPGDASLVQYVSGRAREGEREREKRGAFRHNTQTQTQDATGATTTHFTHMWATQDDADLAFSEHNVLYRAAVSWLT